MTLIDVLPKDSMGQIILSPGGTVDNQEVDGYVSPEWFQNNFPALADATAPLSDADFIALKSIDDFWSINADRWRAQGLI